MTRLRVALREVAAKRRRQRLAEEINDLRTALGMTPDVTFDDIDETDIEWARFSARHRPTSDE